MSGKNRKKRAALPRRTGYAHLASLRFDDSFRERQSESRALIFLRGAFVQLLKFDEQPRNILRLYANAGVFNLYPEMIAAGRKRGYLYVSLFRGEFEVTFFSLSTSLMAASARSGSVK